LDTDIELVETIETPSTGESFVKFSNYTAFWNKQNFELDKPVLKNLNLEFNSKTHLTALVGRIGSGKSTFLLSLLNEIRYSRG
jgi:ABC-type multidrug transport system ATPase subunit